MWSISADGVVSTTISGNSSAGAGAGAGDGGGAGGGGAADQHLCLSYSTSTKAFGGDNQAVVAVPCAAAGQVQTKWHFDGSSTNGSGAFLSIPMGIKCLSDTSACDARGQDSVTVSGASDVSVNGVYQNQGATSDGLPVFFKDETHQLYRYDQVIGAVNRLNRLVGSGDWGY
jgi:hypothetical protein